VKAVTFNIFLVVSEDDKDESTETISAPERRKRKGMQYYSCVFLVEVLLQSTYKPSVFKSKNFRMIKIQYSAF